jgi:hypothetical protein
LPRFHDKALRIHLDQVPGMRVDAGVTGRSFVQAMISGTYGGLYAHHHST